LNLTISLQGCFQWTTLLHYVLHGHRRIDQYPPGLNKQLALIFRYAFAHSQPRRSGLEPRDGQGWVNRVESLLASGVDPNALFRGEEPAISAQADDATLDENATQPPQVYSEPTEMPALRQAIRDLGLDIPRRADLLKTARLMTTLLKHGADPYALFR
jgi:hypothetical protein